MRTKRPRCLICSTHTTRMADMLDLLEGVKRETSSDELAREILESFPPGTLTAEIASRVFRIAQKVSAPAESKHAHPSRDTGRRRPRPGCTRCGSHRCAGTRCLNYISVPTLYPTYLPIADDCHAGNCHDTFDRCGNRRLDCSDCWCANRNINCSACRCGRCHLCTYCTGVRYAQDCVPKQRCMIKEHDLR